MPPNRTRFLLNFATPLALAICLSFALYLTLLWSARQSDILSQDRQRQLVDLIVSNIQAGIAHDQESSTVWDDAVRAVAQSNPDREWLDNNVGAWMHTYFQHDGAFVISPDDHLLVSYLGEARGQQAYAQIAGAARPLLEKLRARLARQDDAGLSDQILSIGESSFASIDERPAVISLKPIISDTGDLNQVPGREFIHIAVRFLDGNFLQSIGREYLLEALQFSPTGISADAAAQATLRASSGEIIGYFLWKPFRPGTAVLSSATPILALVGALILTLMGSLGALAWRRSAHLSKSREQLERMAHTDALTGLPNRASLSQHLALMLAERNPEGCCAVLYLDLDHFKEVNDTLGHPTGDALLIEVAARLKDVAGSLATRVGGDEFVLATRAPDIDALERLCATLISAIRRPFLVHGHPVMIGLSVGVAVADGESDDKDELIRKADIALYHAKTTGRNRYAIFGPHMDELIRSRRDMERDLRAALEAPCQIEVHYQPVFSAMEQEPIGVEALARWRHPTKGYVPPDAFIPVAEATLLIDTLGELVLRRACTAALQWPQLTIAVNASALELRGEGYARRVISVLKEVGLNPARLEIEITESALADDTGHCERNISSLRAIGVRFALDDFGTGFSSFGRLQRMNVDRIKIDKCFVESMAKPGGSEDIVRAMINLAQAKGLKTTAEGIETSEQNDALRRLGCDDIQGYLLSRPVSAAAITAMMTGPATAMRA
jgi:diguanylate cyclase (GGDEF)-like protein